MTASDRISPIVRRYLNGTGAWNNEEDPVSNQVPSPIPGFVDELRDLLQRVMDAAPCYDTRGHHRLYERAVDDLGDAILHLEAAAQLRHTVRVDERGHPGPPPPPSL